MGCSTAARMLDDAVEVEQDRFLHAGRLAGDDAGEAALGKERPHAFEIAGHVGEGETAPPEGGKTRARPLGRLAERLAELLVAHELDAPAERLEQFERHILRRAVERIVRTRCKKRLAVSRALAPILGDGDGDPFDARRDAQGEIAAKAGLRIAARQVLGALAVEEIFECGQALKRDALLYKPVRRGHRLVLLQKRPLNLTQADAFRVRPEEQPLIAVCLVDRAEPEDLDLAPAFDGGGERHFRRLERGLRRLRAQSLGLLLEGSGFRFEIVVAGTDDFGQRVLCDGRVVGLGMRRLRADAEKNETKDK